MTAVAAVVLAAGASLRMGRPKPLLRWRGRTFVQHVIGLAKDAGCRTIVVVQGAWPLPGKAVAEARLVDHPGWEQGPLSSLQIGSRTLLEHGLDPGATGVLVLTVDRPHLRLETIQTLVRAHAEHEHAVLQPETGGRRGHPVLIPRDLVREILRASPRASLRELLEPPEVAVRRLGLEVDDPAIFDNLDTPADLERLPP